MIRFREICRFEITGIAPERFLNIANRRRLHLFNVYCKHGRMFGFIAASEFDTLSDAAQKAGVRLEIVERKGFSLVIRKYRRRMGFVLGLGLFCLTLWVLSRYVWFVDMVNLPEEYAVSVSDLLYREGLRTGVLSSSIDGTQMELALEKELPEFDLVKISCLGCRAEVFFSPSKLEKKDVSDGAPCNLVAAEGGEIVSVVAAEGTPFVRQGDVVFPGDVLVSGLFEGQSDRLSLVHARGTITALVDDTFTQTVPFRQTSTEPTGRTVNINRLMAFGIEIPLFGRLPAGNYDREYEEHPLTVGGFDIPIVLRKERWHELCYVEKTFSKEECIAQADALIAQRVEKKDCIDIIGNERTVNDINGGVRVTRYVTFLKEISEERVILTD